MSLYRALAKQHAQISPRCGLLFESWLLPFLWAFLYSPMMDIVSAETRQQAQVSSCWTVLQLLTLVFLQEVSLSSSLLYMLQQVSSSQQMKAIHLQPSWWFLFVFQPLHIGASQFSDLFSSLPTSFLAGVVLWL